MPRRKDARPPKLLPCPKCHLQLEAGSNPDGVAWHRCRSGAEAAAQALLHSGALPDESQVRGVLNQLVLEGVLDGDVAKVGLASLALKALGGKGGAVSTGASGEYERWRAVASPRAA